MTKTETRTKLNASQTIDIEILLEDRNRSASEDRIYQRAFRSRQISLSDDELTALEAFASDYPEYRPEWL